MRITRPRRRLAAWRNRLAKGRCADQATGVLEGCSVLAAHAYAHPPGGPSAETQTFGSLAGLEGIVAYWMAVVNTTSTQ